MGEQGRDDQADRRAAEETAGRSLAPSFANEVGSAGAVTPLTDWTTFTLRCFPSGACSAATLFFRGRGRAAKRR